MHTVLVLGAGKVGALIATMLSGSGDYRLGLADRDAAQAERVAAGEDRT